MNLVSKKPNFQPILIQMDQYWSKLVEKIQFFNIAPKFDSNETKSIEPGVKKSKFPTNSDNKPFKNGQSWSKKFKFVKIAPKFDWNETKSIEADVKKSNFASNLLKNLKNPIQTNPTSKILAKIEFQPDKTNQ